MKEELNIILINELQAMEGLLKALEKQHSCLIESDAVTLENCVKEIDTYNRKIAEWEVKRREITQGGAMREVIHEAKDDNLEDNYRKLRRIIEETKLQKDTNELLIKQGLGFANRILNILNPSRSPKTYNSFGKVYK
ncbi:flagellar protein FlgN [Candidatus Clostridium radicumherbarum]|uniref:Flagellar protein FlgN n=1 Tax=Candidatus Clostridium radicumherbarum TaxID=3381662 RepID=A0ABW8TVF2_9CLOT